MDRVVNDCIDIIARIMALDDEGRFSEAMELRDVLYTKYVDFGRFMLAGHCIVRDTCAMSRAEAMDVVERFADGGNTRAMVLLAECYLRGDFVPRDPTKALKLLKTASDRDDPDAMLYHGIMVLHGIGTEPSYDEGFDLILRSARRYMPEAMAYLGRMLRENSDYAQMDELASELTRAAAGCFTCDLDDVLWAIDTMVKVGCTEKMD